MEALRKEEHYTYADYCTWPEDERWELIDGVPYAMATPNEAHQLISVELVKQLAIFLDGKPCKVYHAPFSVRLNAEKGDDTVVEPDIFVVCDKSKRDGKCIKGAPDLVIEIQSPSTARHDKVTKFNKYLNAGVREYWLIDPTFKTVQVYSFENGSKGSAYNDTDKAPVGILPGCVIDLQAVFAE